VTAIPPSNLEEVHWLNESSYRRNEDKAKIKGEAGFFLF
jgi:hypothetical protein